MGAACPMAQSGLQIRCFEPKTTPTSPPLAALSTGSFPAAVVQLCDRAVLLDAGEAPPKLRTFLRDNGITPRKDRVISRENDSLVTSARGVFSKGIAFTRELAGQATEFGGASSSLAVREGAEALLNRRIYPMSLIDVPAGFWGETKFLPGWASSPTRNSSPPPTTGPKTSISSPPR